MERNNINSHADSSKLSKEEKIRRASSNVSSMVNDEIHMREEARRNRTNDFTDTQRVDNPYMRSDYDRPAGHAGNAYDAPRRRPDQPHRGNGGKRRRKKKKKNRQKILLVIIIILIVVIAGIGGGGYYWYTSSMAKYDGVFLENTYINGTDVSGKTPDEAAELVTQDSDIPDVITLTRPDGTDIVFSMDSLDMTNNILSSVTDLYSGQDHREWLTAQNEKTEYSFILEYDYDADKLYELVDDRVVGETEGTSEPEDAYIEKTDDGFEIVPEVVGTSIDEEKTEELHEYIQGFLDREVYSINLANCGCFELPEVTSDDLKDKLEVLESLYDVTFEFDFTYTTETLTGETTLDWITFETDNPEDGFSVDDDKVMSYVEELAEKYDTFGKDRTFVSTSRGEMTIEQGEGDYGWWIDQEKTCAMIVDLIKDGISAKVEPYYYTNPDSQYTYTCDESVRTAESDIGDTYIEIDLAEQHLWYYLDGELDYECDIVSGKPTEARNTPGGVYKLWYKELNKVLSGTTSAGESWSTPVTYWNNISTFGVGLHDASWQSSFGGTRYKNYGSHGCINMPVSAAKYVYENIEINTPVIMYW